MLTNLNDILKKAQEGTHTVGLFNTTDTDMLEGVIAAAEELNSPVIIGTAEILLPYGELSLIAPSVVARAKQAKVPVVVHYDHGLTFERCMEALHLGFTSIMYDGSEKEYEQNLAETREIVKIAHSFGCSVEGEIGHVGQACKGDENLTDSYTTPDEAEAFVKATGVDAVAVSFGSAHGVYKKKPNLNLARLQEIRARIDTPLVLHGGSGLSDDDFRNTIRDGVAKVNIFTDLCLAGERAVADSLRDGMDYLEMRNRKVAYIKEEVKKKIRLFGSEGKA